MVSFAKSNRAFDVFMKWSKNSSAAWEEYRSIWYLTNANPDKVNAARAEWKRIRAIANRYRTIYDRVRRETNRAFNEEMAALGSDFRLDVD